MGGLGGLGGAGPGLAAGQPGAQPGLGAGAGAGLGGGMDLNALLQGLNAGGQGGAGAGAGAGAGLGGGMDLNALLQGLNAGGQGGAGAGLGAGAGPGFNFGNFVPPQQQVNMTLPPEERYKDQLQQMAEMGFTNKELNIQMLDATGGNVQLALERLLSMLG